MNIAIVDDNAAFVSSLEDYIGKICLQNRIDCEIDSFNNGMSVIKNYGRYHLIFLDIDMPDIDGLTAAEKINSLKGKNDFPYIVFVTCNDNLVFKALRQYPYSFVRKSELYEDIKSCVLKIDEKLKADNAKYCIKTGRKIILVNLDDVYYLEKVKNYIHYYTKTEVFKERSTMDEKESELSTLGFIRTHIGYLVNVKHISEIATNEIILDNFCKIPVSKRYKPELKGKYYKWLVNLYD